MANRFKKTVLGLAVVFLAGCATSTSYVHYTAREFPPKDQFYPVNIYPQSQPLGTQKPYFVIGKISIEGFFSNGVSAETLAKRAKTIARQKGADAIINTSTQVIRYWGDTLLRFTGDLIVYAPNPPTH